MNTYSPTYSDDDDEMGDIVEAYAEQEASDRPTVTDQALAEAWAEGHRTGWEHCQDGNYGNDYWDDPTPNPYAAAAHAETTAEQPCRHCGSCDGPPSCPDCDHADRHAETTAATTEDAARAIHDRHCTSDDHGPHCMFWDEDYESAEALHARGLLATARTLPTREQIARALDRAGAFCGVCGREPGDPLDDCDDCRSCLHRYADAVLTLLRGDDE